MASEHEILFRGQTRRRGEKVRMADRAPVEGNWVYGGVFAPNQTGDFAVIYGYDPVEKHSVYRDTVGQYTGLKDKNGKRIFEGDIVNYNGTAHQVVFEQRGGCAYFGIVMDDTETWMFDASVPAYIMEIIGNIYDNPELLEEGTE